MSAPTPERSEIEADAARYRWLRKRNDDGVDPVGPYVTIDDGTTWFPSGPRLDALIDDAMSREQAKEKQ